MQAIATALSQIQAQINQYAKACGRKPEDITLVAVSKTKPLADILAAYQAGQRIFAENYLQEALEKISAAADYAIEWHFIGRIQSNKTRDIASHFHWVHTLDNIKHARRLNDQRPSHLAALQVCIQVNLSGEQSKGGVNASEVIGLADVLRSLPRLKLRGLMTMPDPATDMATQRKIFRQLRQLHDDLNQQGYDLDTLSMGMSNDLEAAICEGATMVRIGTAIFGTRS